MTEASLETQFVSNSSHRGGNVKKKSIAIGIMIGVFVAGAVVAGAQYSGIVSFPYALSESVPEIIPYRGYIERNGAAYTGNATFTFSIYPDTSTTTALWSETQMNLPVTGGNFSAQLGSVQAFTTATGAVLGGHPLFQYPELHIGVAVQFPGDPSPTPLTGRQRLLASPYAVTARQAEDFTVNGRLIVNNGGTGNISINAAGDIQTAGTLYPAHIRGGISTTAEYTASTVLGTQGTVRTTIGTYPLAYNVVCSLTRNYTQGIGSSSISSQACYVDIIQTGGPLGPRQYDVVASQSGVTANGLVECRAQCILFP